jgi:cysteinyl-tRNA synthetase
LRQPGIRHGDQQVHIGVGPRDDPSLVGSVEVVEREGLRIAATSAGATPLTPEAVRAVIKDRVDARAAKDFARSDELRRQLNAHGVDVLDSKSGSSWRFA